MPDDVKSKRKSEERRWLGEMERLGYPIVAARFANRMAVIDMMPYPEADFVQAWLRKKERAATRRLASGFDRGRHDDRGRYCCVAHRQRLDQIRPTCKPR
jgi:hypothetical protein